LFVSRPAHAETSASVSESSLDDVTVTATRTATSVADALASVTVLTRDDIESRQVLSLQELFEGEAGVQVSNNGGLGKASSVFLRGANADQVLVLVDGVRMGSATLGTTGFQYLPLDQIGRVEIVRGPLSSLYGSEAMGGVIQLFTQRPTADGVSLQADAAAGSHDTYRVGANWAVVSGPLSYGLGASNLTSSGYPNCSGAAPSSTSFGGGCYVNDSSPDGYHNVSTSAHIGYRFSDSADAEATFMRAQGGTRYAGSYTNHEDFVQQAAAVSGHWAPVAALRLTAQVGQSHDNERDTLDFVESPGNLFDTTRNSASLQADWTMAPHQLLTLGTDYLHDTIASDAGFPVTSRRVSGVFGEYQGTLGAQQLALSARQDHNSQFGNKTTGSAAWGYRFAETMRLTASYGTAFHAPSFDELYYPYFGNPALKPETSRSFELGLDQRLKMAHWSVRGFDSEIDNLISYDAVLFAPENTDRARIHGIELQGGIAVGAWTGDLTGTWLDARNRTMGSPYYGNELTRRARGTGRVEVARQWSHVRLAARVNVAGPSFDDVANTAPLGGYTTVDTLLEWTPTKRWVLQAKVANLTDHRYQTAQYYPQDGRNFLVTLRYRQ
ncbi:MAG: TonB-dependent vitamin receptor, partial [Gammaproteobacteria bacterium]|nr:TonB-dependent vitamin receptor [Gammaproteobacteria bacterium]